MPLGRSCSLQAFSNILAHRPVILLGPKQPVQEQDRRRLAVKLGLRRLMEIKGQWRDDV